MSRGRKEDPEPMMFLPAVEVYGHIPKEHFYEELSRLLDLSFIYDLTKPLYADRIGRPSLDPVVFFKCMLVAFFENIVYDTELEFAGKKVLIAAAGWNLLLLVKALMHGSTLGTAVCVLIGLILALLNRFRRLQEAILTTDRPTNLIRQRVVSRATTARIFARNACLSGVC